MASGIALGRVRTATATTESRKMAAIVQLIDIWRHTALDYSVLLSVILDIHVMVKDTCQNRVSAGLSDKVLVFDWIAGSCLVNVL